MRVGFACPSGTTAGGGGVPSHAPARSHDSAMALASSLQSQTITRSSFGATQNYSYTDGVNRLTGASEASWSQTYSYDNVGNRSVTAGIVLAPDFTPTPGSFNSSNQWAPTGGISAGYDLAGNMTSVSIASPAVTEVTESRQCPNRVPVSRPCPRRPSRLTPASAWARSRSRWPSCK